MLTPDELELIKADIKAEVMKELTGNDIRTPQKKDRPLSTIYLRYHKQLQEKYGVYKWYQIWNAVRLLTTFKLGHRYVRDIKPSEEVEGAKFAEQLLLMMGLEKVDGDTP